MKVPIRTTAAGTEYWCTEEKRTLFIPAGESPSFEVTENPKFMLTKDPAPESTDKIYLDDMTVKELREYAAEQGVEIPSDVKKKEDILNLLS